MVDMDEHELFMELFERAIRYEEIDRSTTTMWDGPIGIGDCRFYLDVFRNRFVDCDSLKIVEELLESEDPGNVIMAAAILNELKIK